MKKILYVAILLLCTICNTAIAQSIMGKWYMHTKDSGEGKTLILEFSQPNKVKLSMNIEQTDKNGSYFLKASVVGNFSMKGKAMSINLDKNSIKTSVNAEFSDYLKDLLKQLKVKDLREYNRSMARFENLKVQISSKLKQMMTVEATMGSQIQILKFTDSEIRILEGDNFASLTREESAEHDECGTFRNAISEAKNKFISTDYQSLFTDYIYPTSLPDFAPEYPNDSIYKTADVAPKSPYNLWRYIAERIPRFDEKVEVALTVRKDGSITNVEVIECPNSRLSSNMVNILSNMPKWEPAKKNGRSVSYRLELQISF